jgi:hypothetical protein
MRQCLSHWSFTAEAAKHAEPFVMLRALCVFYGKRDRGDSTITAELAEGAEALGGRSFTAEARSVRLQPDFTGSPAGLTVHRPVSLR